MTSVDSNFNFLCGRPHGAGPPRPPEPGPLSPLHVDVINGWPLTRSLIYQSSKYRSFTIWENLCSSFLVTVLHVRLHVRFDYFSRLRPRISQVKKKLLKLM